MGTGTCTRSSRSDQKARVRARMRSPLTIISEQHAGALKWRGIGPTPPCTHSHTSDCSPYAENTVPGNQMNQLRIHFSTALPRAQASAVICIVMHCMCCATSVQHHRKPVSVLRQRGRWRWLCGGKAPGTTAATAAAGWRFWQLPNLPRQCRHSGLVPGRVWGAEGSWWRLDPACTVDGRSPCPTTTTLPSTQLKTAKHAESSAMM